MTPRGGMALRTVRVLFAVFALSLFFPSAAFPQTSAGDTGMSKEELAGKRIYLEGTDSLGKPLRSWIRGDVFISGKVVPCVRCHRRSGMGEREGRTIVRPVTGAALYRPEEVYGTGPGRAAYPASKFWPVYTDETLAGAILEGVDPKGRVLDAVMPRYEVSEQDLSFLIAYMKSLSTVAPGVTDNVVRLATVVDTRVDAMKRKEMLDVLLTAFREMSAGSRQEMQRRGQAPWGTTHWYYAYRDIELDVWEVSGPEETWEAQLDAHYRRKPVFALVSGTAAGKWEPVNRFCERLGIPYVLPNTNLPFLEGDNYTTVYFSKGVALEAAAIARHLQTDGQTAGKGPIVQIFRDDEAGTTAAAAFREEARKSGIGAPRDLHVEGGEELTAEFWRRLFEANRPSTVVFWVRGADLKGLEGVENGSSPPANLYLSSSFGAGPKTSVPKTFAGRAYLAHPFLLPTEERKQIERTRIWLKSRGINGPDERMQVNTFFAAALTKRVIKGIFTFFSRDYFLEMVEHETENMLAPTVFPRVSLGPGQRFVSKGCYILRYPNRPGEPMTSSGGRIIP